MKHVWQSIMIVRVLAMVVLLLAVFVLGITSDHTVRDSLCGGSGEKYEWVTEVQYPRMTKAMVYSQDQPKETLEGLVIVKEYFSPNMNQSCGDEVIFSRNAGFVMIRKY